MINGNDSKKNITIDNFTGGESGTDLKGCYFKYDKSNGSYDFHDKDGKEKCKDLVVGTGCSFVLDDNPNVTWSIALTEPCSEVLVNGNWGNNVSGDTGEEGGTFQGQAGGSMDADASAASASGY
jgi:hypothetical protein